jgi:hypothetical protein
MARVARTTQRGHVRSKVRFPLGATGFECNSGSGRGLPIEVRKIRPQRGRGEGVTRGVALGIRPPLIAAGREEMGKCHQHDGNRIGMFFSPGQIDGLAGAHHPIDCIHVAVDRVHQNLPRENLVFKGGRDRVLRQCCAAQSAKQSRKSREAADTADDARFNSKIIAARDYARLPLISVEQHCKTNSPAEEDDSYPQCDGKQGSDLARPRNRRFSIPVRRTAGNSQLKDQHINAG